MRFIERRAVSKPVFGIDDLLLARRFLFLEYDLALGVNVHATPVFEALKLAVPDAVTMVAGSRIAYEVFRHNPFIDFLVETPRPANIFVRAVRTLRGHLKATGFVTEVVITSVGNKTRSNALLAFMAANATHSR